MLLAVRQDAVHGIKSLKIMIIGYLIPEFPGQTHNFFWREREALAELGVDVILISTRRPPKSLASPSWAKKAIDDTKYLFPVKVSEIFKLASFLLLAGPSAWRRCVRLALSADNLSWTQKLRLLVLILFAAKLVLIARKHNFRHMHVHSCADSANIAMFASQLADISYSMTLHNPLDTFGGNQRNKWRHAKFGIVITERLRSQVGRRLAGFLPPTVSVAPMGVNTNIFKRRVPYGPFNGAEQLRLFCCARLNPAKGFDYLIGAVCMLLKNGVDVRLEIAGEDDAGGTKYRKHLEHLILENGVSNKVELLGAVGEENVISYLEGAHIFVLASIEEPLGVAIMEAMSMGVPVVATNAGGVPELVANGYDGILVAPKSSSAICEAILEIAKNPDVAAKLSANGRAKIEKFFNHRISAQVIAEEVLRQEFC